MFESFKKHFGRAARGWVREQARNLRKALDETCDDTPPPSEREPKRKSTSEDAVRRLERLL